MQTLLIDKARLEKDLEIANDKLSAALSECKTKDELVKKLTNMEQEAIASNSLFFLFLPTLPYKFLKVLFFTMQKYNIHS